MTSTLNSAELSGAIGLRVNVWPSIVSVNGCVALYGTNEVLDSSISGS